MAASGPPPGPLQKVSLATAICARWQSFSLYLTFMHKLWASLGALWRHDCRPEGSAGNALTPPFGRSLRHAW
jgi:hypothetical protein